MDDEEENLTDNGEKMSTGVWKQWRRIKWKQNGTLVKLLSGKSI